jgi:hypothetical protein
MTLPGAVMGDFWLLYASDEAKISDPLRTVDGEC